MRIFLFLTLFLASVELLDVGSFPTLQCNQRITERRMRCLERRARHIDRYLKEAMEKIASTLTTSATTTMAPEKIANSEQIVLSFILSSASNLPKGIESINGELKNSLQTFTCLFKAIQIESENVLQTFPKQHTKVCVV